MSSQPLNSAVPRLVAASVESFDGTLIHFDVHESPSRKIALVIPGFWRTRRWPSMLHLAARVGALGFRPVVMDTRGHGDSGGIYGFNRHEHHDTWAVIEWLFRMELADSIQLIGFSYGGAIAIATRARHEFPCSGLLLISSVADYDMIAPRLNLFTMHRHLAFRNAFRRPRFQWNARKSEKLRALDDVGQIAEPVCLIHVKDDWLIHHRHSEALFERATEPKRIHIIDRPGAYHADRIFSAYPGEIEPLMENFLRRCLEEVETKTPR